ncbi:M3 family oligoendopeptidase [Halomarina salina]|uniref:M3 family oligoendopeptidase n=1 Tax=Halomarina salina TaxID=1872699 RepID=A0ABD5RLX5_9EURY|nr:M3 family metallopeptidase [Halomarina salina]
MSEVPTRDGLPPEYRWRREHLFDSPEAWDDEADAFAEALDDLRAFEGRVTDDGETLLAMLDRYESIQAKESRLWVHARMGTLQDTTDEDAAARMRRFRSLHGEREKAVSYLDGALADAGRERIESFVGATEGLERYSSFLDERLREAAHAPSTEVLETLADLDAALDAPGRTLTTLKNADFDAPTVERPDASEATVTSQTRQRLLRHPDRAFRRRVHEAYLDELAEARSTRAQAFSDHLQGHDARASIRGYDSALDEALGGTFDPNLHAALRKTVVENLAPLERRNSLLSKRLGVETLHEWDTRMPFTEGEGPEIPYDKACDIVVSALEPLGETYQDRVESLLSERRVDVYETREKLTEVRGMALATDRGEAFLHLNYAEDLRSLYFFCHELGHAMHAVSSEATALDGVFPDHLVEVFSFTHEALLTRYLLDTGYPAGHVLDTALGKIPLFVGVRWMSFVDAVYDHLDAGRELTADRLGETYVEVQRAQRPGVEFGEGDERGWMVEHLSRDPHFSYLYVLGTSCGLALADRLHRGALAPETYHGVLREGGALSPDDAFERLGLDPVTAVEDALDVYDGYLDELA